MNGLLKISTIAAGAVAIAVASFFDHAALMIGITAAVMAGFFLLTVFMGAGVAVRHPTRGLSSSAATLSDVTPDITHVQKP